MDKGALEESVAAQVPDLLMGSEARGRICGGYSPAEFSAGACLLYI